ncbi:SCO4225 family membrane protein [Streptomyces sp. NBC_01423]|uniref:SCO4225 family membrane protein n=1 Tax=Streptomyces sp. NBC_01423 TaxID=2903860 RepID=UPI002E2BC780|nr:hypothetical protein [Streptomyces sp. NBC_01423]
MFRLTFANPVSAVYLGFVGASLVVEALVATFGDPGFIGIWPFLLTAPASLLFTMLGIDVWGNTEVPYWYVTGGIVAGALAQAFALGALTETLRGRPRRTAAR